MVASPLSSTSAKSETKLGIFKPYETKAYYDEMLTADGNVRQHYARFIEHFSTLSPEEFEAKRHAIDLAFLRQGITFNVYGDAQGTERVFPFDLMPRIIPSAEWEHLEKGLIQRITALNMFLHDIYHEQHILKDGTIPAHYVLSARHFRREFVNFEVPKTSTSTSAAPTSSATRKASISSSRTTVAARPA
jgi:uncharacterized circularly permuted ATP-grasp superfamily protein